MPKNRAKPKSTAPTQERRIHNGGVVSEPVTWDKDGKSVVNRYRAVWETPLDAYKDSDLITDPQHKAGLRYREAYHKAVLSRPPIYKGLVPTPANTELTKSEKLIKDAHRIISPDNKEVVVNVCGHGQMIYSERALDKLRKGLGELAISWHMAAIETCDHKKSKN